MLVFSQCIFQGGICLSLAVNYMNVEFWELET